jgi:FtsP/CotA-like multicopper oxidase with cupredoxin domain
VCSSDLSPLGNSDNVTLRIQPQTSFDYEIAIPKDHPPGTFWYHAHVHGSTALQVSSGMAGAIIIEGGLDAVPQIAAAASQILMFQQIAYDEEGKLENYDHFGPDEWPDSDRRTTINGQIVPRIDMQPGEVQRWRMIHGGVRETLLPTFVSWPDEIDLAAVEQLDSAALSALPEAAKFHEIAVDGLALGRIDAWSSIELQPGYRSDVLIKAPQESGSYALIDAASGPEASLLGDEEEGRILAFIRVDGAAIDMPLPTDAEVADLLPHQPILDAELTGRPQEVRMEIGRRLCDDDGVCKETCNEGDEGCAVRFMVNDRPFSETRDRALELGTAAEWTLATAGHPFHIHVNPFQVERNGPDGQSQTVWKDTLFIKSGVAKVRTRYERFIGTFVLHCHILDHEDQGMMELVTIVAPPVGRLD